MKSEELENPDNVKFSYGGADIPVTANSAFKTYDGTVTLKKIRCGFTAGASFRRSMEQYAQGNRQGGPLNPEGGRLVEKI